MNVSPWLSVLPSLSAIIAAVITKQVIPSLLLGLWIGSFIISPGILSSISKTIDYLISMLSKPGNLNVILFLYVFSGLVSMIQAAGGVSGFANTMSRWVKTKRGSLWGTWLLLPLTFIDCGFRVVAAGAIIKPLAKRYHVPGEQLAYTLNNSASPVISLIPVATTYVGYMIGVIASGMHLAGASGSPFVIFLRTIPFNFFSLTSIAVALFSIVSPWQFPAMRQAGQRHQASAPETNEMDTTKDQMGVATGKNMEHDHDTAMESILPPRGYNLFIPIGLLIPLSFITIWWDGRTKANSLLGIFSQADASRDMFLALFLTAIITVIVYMLQGLELKELTERFIKGGNKLMATIIILTVAWPIATVSRDLGLPSLINQTIGTTLPGVWVPVVIFLTTSAVTYFIGSSWGAWALMMPLAIPLATTTGIPIEIAAAAVFSGGTFGDVTSPLSGMAAMASGIAEVEHMDYIRAMSPYNLIAAFLAAILFVLAPLFWS